MGIWVTCCALRSKLIAGACAAGLLLAGGLVTAGCNMALGVDDFSADGCPSVGSKRCVGNALESCDPDGEWREARECTAGCKDGACVIDCVQGQQRCAGESPQVCDAGGQWLFPGAACPATKPCSGGLCGAVCVPGDLRCAGGGVAQACDREGQWQGDKACPNKCVAGVCTECIPGERVCENKMPRLCTQSGHWLYGTACTKDQQCNASGECE